jgi:hypothetical protein
MMLASTVQFSRYGRSRPSVACSAGRHRSCPRRPHHAAVPSGPNSVLGPCDSQEGVPCQGALRHRAAVLTSQGSRPDRIASAPLMSSHLRTLA